MAQAQQPLTVDTTFQIYYTPAVMQQGDELYNNPWIPFVDEVVQRADGRLLIKGSHLTKPAFVPWGSPWGVYNSVVISHTGEAEEYLPGMMGGGVAELPFTSQYFALITRYNYDCTKDFSFAPDHGPFRAFVTFSGRDNYQMFEDRSVLLSGTFDLDTAPYVYYALVKLDEWGGLDTTFVLREVLGAPPIGMSIFSLSGGGYLFNGTWTHYDGRPVGSLVRLFADGALDTTFHYPSSRSLVHAVHEQADGKMVIGGLIWLDGHPDTLHVVRLNVDGSVDGTFHNFADYRFGDTGNSSLFANISCITPLDEGRLFIGGWFDRIDGQPRSAIACVDTTGQLSDCWAEGGLVPHPGALFGAMGRLKCLPNGDCYIYGGYRGFIDANGLHPEQAMISRLHMPTVGVGEVPAPRPTAHIWPNPGEGSVELYWAGHATATVEVYDGLGRTVVAPRMLHRPFRTELGALPPGLYHVSLTAPTGERAVVKWLRE